MSFPWHHAPWREVAEFLKGRTQPDERILAPDAFWMVVSRVQRYVPSNLGADQKYDWVVLNLEDLEQIPRAFVSVIDAQMSPVYVNDQFVVWSTVATEPDAGVDDRIAAVRARIQELSAAPSVPNQFELDAALADAPEIVRHLDLTDREVRASMDDLHARTGYQYPTLRDQAYRADIEAVVVAAVERCRGRVLDVGSGSKAFPSTSSRRPVLRTDLSEVAVRIARDQDREATGPFTYAAMDAERLACRDASFDGALFVDTIEHVRSAARVLQELSRVLVDGGELTCTFANRNSINQTLTRKLGYPEYVTNHQHMREFTLGDVAELLDRNGFDIESTAGITLYPYWGVPLVDDHVRHLTDNDPEFVEIMRELGRRVGAEYAYTGLVTARRRARRTIVLVVPIAPAATGNGLAMRAGMLLESLATGNRVHVIVVPVSGAGDVSWAAERAASVTVLPTVGTAESARAHTTQQLADADLRTRLEQGAPVPQRAALAPPTLAASAIAALPIGVNAPDAVVAMRLYLAPLGIQIARRLSAGRIVVDADDDDAALLHSLGDREEAGAFERLAATWLADADMVLTASDADAASMRERAGVGRVEVVPNAVRTPAAVLPPPDHDRVLFVGNLSYEPNRVAARLLAREILPALRARRPNATLDLVGPHGGEHDELGALGELPGVRVTGAVPDVGPWYAEADVVVVPLRHGAGTRIKILEAFAFRRPVVATSIAATGLDLAHDEVVTAESSDDLASAVDAVLADPAGSAAMVERAARLLDSRYTLAAVGPKVRAAALGPSTPHPVPEGAQEGPDPR